MNKGQMKRDADTHALLRRIESRWKSIERARAWTDLPQRDREEVLELLEHEARSSADPRSAKAAWAALDALESMQDVVALFGVHAASPDVQALIAIAKGEGPNER